MNTVFRLFSQPAAPRLRLPVLLLVAWLLAMISVPVLRWTVGDPALPLAIIFTSFLLAATVVSLLGPPWGTARVLYAVVVIGVGSWAIERVGSTTGWPFGVYAYTDALQPQIGHVPLVIPIAWLMMLPPAWAVAQLITEGQVADTQVAAAQITGSRRKIIAGKRPLRASLRLCVKFLTHRWRFILVSGLAFMAWDLFLDPQMVGWGFWTWAAHDGWLGGYFGIPWLNFFGWWLGASLLTALVQPPTVPARPLLLIYTITWALQLSGQLILWGQPGPALVGGVAMGAFVVLGWRRIIED